MGKPFVDPQNAALFIVRSPEGEAMKALAENKGAAAFYALENPENPPEQQQLVFARAPEAPVRSALRARGKRVHILDPRVESGRAYRPAGIGKSALEGFAELIGAELNEAQWKIAIAARDGYSGLAELGVPLQEAKKLRQAHFSALDPKIKLDQARQYVQEHLRELDDLRLAVIGDEYKEVALEAALEPDPGAPEAESYKWKCERRRPWIPKPVLILYLKEAMAQVSLERDANADDARQALAIRLQSERIAGIGLATGAQHGDWLRALLDDGKLGSSFELWLERGQHQCRFGAWVKKDYPGGAVDALVSRLLSVLLVTGRPLRYYTASFLLPLDLRGEKELEDSAT